MADSVSEPAPPAPLALQLATLSYLVDALQRGVLTLDVLRERGDRFLEHLTAGKPPLLDFAYETLVDGRTLPQPCNYQLLRIVPPAGTRVVASQRPIVIVDPRAGHGPGIGGFKPDSEIGVALRQGHPVYFVAFQPEPVDGQTLADVARAEAAFIDAVRARHPRAPHPAVLANCQAGWALAGLAAVDQRIRGPLVLNGAPLSYWSGSPQQNPMRYAGGVLGGAWLAALASDLSGDRFDGAWLVQNFESLNLANTLWGKLYHLYADVDGERERFLQFERWWGGYFRMTGEEIEAIVENLFIGNRLARGELVVEGRAVDLRAIEAPMVIFSSWGDNITPPQQALDWIIDVWGHEDAIAAAGRTIVYLLHPGIGHLGIFVGAAVAKREHAQIINALDQVDALAPGLYEMTITARDGGDAPTQAATALATADAAPADAQVTRAATTQLQALEVHFAPRRVDDIRALNADGRRDEALFGNVARLSEANMQAYRQWLQPLVRAVGSPQLGEWLRWLHPLRQQHLALSSLSPGAPLLAGLAALARTQRKPVDPANPWLAWEHLFSQNITQGLDQLGWLRDTATAQWVSQAYGPHGLFGLPALFRTEGKA